MQSFAEITTPDDKIISAKPILAEQTLPDITSIDKQKSASQTSYTTAQLKQDKNLTEYLFNQAVEKNNFAAMEYLLKIYRTFPSIDPILVKFAEAKLAKNKENYSTAIRLYEEILAEHPELTPVRIELAVALFNDQQNNASETQFQHALITKDLPTDIGQFIQLYLNTLDKRNDWKIDIGVNYTRDGNVNNVSKERYIENTAFVKGDSMLPQTAHGLNYRLNIEREFYLSGHHNLYFGNLLNGLNYWDNHDYDDMTNRTYFGYANKSAKQRWALLPFYERQWYGNHRYKWAQGVRLEFNRWLSKNWQISTALEYRKQKYHQHTYLDGNYKLASTTLLWRITPQFYVYTGFDFGREKTAISRYGYDLKSVRAGWGQDWIFGQLSSRFSFNYSKRHYNENFVLANVFYFDKKRQDEIYNINATLWKRDWHLWGITPKLNFSWKKQDSNFDSLFSYTDRNISILFERNF